MANTLAMRIGDGVANVNQTSQELSSQKVRSLFIMRFPMQFLDGLGKCFGIFSRNKPHGVKGLIVGVDSEAIDREDAWVFQTGGDERFLKESFLIAFIVGAIGLDYFQGNLTGEVFIQSD